MTVELRWWWRVLAAVASPFAGLALGRLLSLTVEAFARWIGLDASTAEFFGGYAGIVAGFAACLALIAIAVGIWRPLQDQAQKGSDRE